MLWADSIGCQQVADCYLKSLREFIQVVQAEVTFSSLNATYIGGDEDPNARPGLLGPAAQEVKTLRQEAVGGKGFWARSRPGLRRRALAQRRPWRYQVAARGIAGPAGSGQSSPKASWRKKNPLRLQKYDIESPAKPSPLSNG